MFISSVAVCASSCYPRKPSNLPAGSLPDDLVEWPCRDLELHCIIKDNLSSFANSRNTKINPLSILEGGIAHGCVKRKRKGEPSINPVCSERTDTWPDSPRASSLHRLLNWPCGPKFCSQLQKALAGRQEKCVTIFPYFLLQEPSDR